ARCRRTNGGFCAKPAHGSMNGLTMWGSRNISKGDSPLKKPEPFFRVTFRAERGANMEPWTVYRTLDDAILAAEGLITSDLAVESEVISVTGPNESTSVFRVQIDADGAILARRTAQ